jgi:hypothetical protein
MGNNTSYVVKKDRINYNNPTYCRNTISLLRKSEIDVEQCQLQDSFARHNIEDTVVDTTECNKLLLKRIYNYFIDNEKTLCDSYYAFYSSWSTTVQMLIDVYYVYDCIVNNKEINVNKRKLRWSLKYNTIEEFINSEKFIEMNQRDWDDWCSFFRSHFISANISLFGNMNNSCEDSFAFFARNNNMVEPNLEYFYDSIELDDSEKIKKFDDFIIKIMQKYYTGIFGVYNQIFIKKEAVTKCVYLSKAFGQPAIDMLSDFNKLLLDALITNAKDVIGTLAGHAISKTEDIDNYINDLQARILVGSAFEENSLVFSSDNYINNKMLYYVELAEGIKSILL